MLKRDSLILIVAVASGLFSFILIVNYLKSSSAVKTQFVIASRSIAKGQVINTEDVLLSGAMQSKTPNLLYLQVEDVIGGITNEDIAKSSLIYRSQILAPSVPAPLKKQVSLPIPEGMSALTLASGQIDVLPEDMEAGKYADILGVVSEAGDSRDIQPIVRGVQVLSINRAESSEVKAITIAVTPYGAIVVSKAMTRGKLGLVLRPDGAESGAYHPGVVGSIEIIRGVQKEKSVKSRMEKE